MGTSKVKVDFSEIRKAAETLSQANTALVLENITNELGARLLAKAIKRTPVDKGTLRRGWDASIGAKAVNTGGGYTVTITNSVEYASYVEFGHRQTPGRYVPAIGKRLKKSWVKGKFMLTISEEELRKEAPAVIKRKISEWLKKLGG